MVQGQFVTKRMVEYVKERLDNGSEIVWEQIQRRRCPGVRDAFLEGMSEGRPSRKPAAVICHSYGCSLECSGSARDVEPDDGPDNEGASNGNEIEVAARPLAQPPGMPRMMPPSDRPITPPRRPQSRAWGSIS